ncbi:hypothetical protein F4804DRAFT_134190 [Jackrogersella minutella]|nr:hypothetical protein F4804DRAFT_134190 [Jackrogersella minutella]
MRQSFVAFNNMFYLVLSIVSGAKGSLGVAQAWRAIEAPLWGPTGWVYKGGKIPRSFGRASVKDFINLSTAFTTQRAYGKPLVTDLSLCDTLPRTGYTPDILTLPSPQSRPSEKEQRYLQAINPLPPSYH